VTGNSIRHLLPCALGLLVLAVPLPAAPAQAARGLSLRERADILRTVRWTAPNGRRMRDPRCITGRLSTVDRRWAGAFLTNSRSCVRRYGAASGESVLLRRRSSGARRWRIAGAVGDNCTRGAGGASDRVLLDLGCTLYG
jgi:hypothetical protein